jgi:hypothetical protein
MLTCTYSLNLTGGTIKEREKKSAPCTLKVSLVSSRKVSGFLLCPKDKPRYSSGNRRRMKSFSVRQQVPRSRSRIYIVALQAIARTTDFLSEETHARDSWRVFNDEAICVSLPVNTIVYFQTRFSFLRNGNS